MGLRVDVTGLSSEQIAARLESDLRSEVRLAPHDPSWAGLFELERAVLGQALGPLATSIEHVGSTAVAGLAAKPVIDVLVTTTWTSAMPCVRTRISAAATRR